MWELRKCLFASCSSPPPQQETRCIWAKRSHHILLECHDRIWGSRACQFLFWPKDDFEYLIITMYNFQVSYIALAAMAVDAGKLRFGYPAKGHYFEHLVVDHLGLVPSRVWCYRYEDFMGRLVQCAQRCIAGTPLTLVGSKVLQNYRMVGTLEIRQKKHTHTICGLKKPRFGGRKAPHLLIIMSSQTRPHIRCFSIYIYLFIYRAMTSM